MTGEWPNHDIDHFNGNRTDNKWNNLRKASRAENCQNRQVQSRTKSNIKGIHWREDAKKWRAFIRVDGKLIHLGYFKSKDEAEQKYIEASENYFGVFSVSKRGVI